MESSNRKRAARAVALSVTLVIGSLTSLAATPGPAGAAGSTSSSTSVVSSAPGGSSLAQAVTYTATVAPTSGSGATPTGSVAFTDNGTVITGCSGVALAPGSGSSATAQCTPPASAMSAGSHPIVASYAGDSRYATSTATLDQSVSTATTSTVVTSSPASPSPFGVAVTYTATVTAGGGVTAFTPTGSVSFGDGGSVLCASAALSVVSPGVAHATCAEPGASMTIGTHPISTTYSTDANFSAGTSGSLTQSVVADTTATVLGSAPASPSPLATAVTYTATVTAGNGVSTDPTGTIVFKDGATTLCSPGVTATATPGVVNAACTEPGSSMTGGAHSVSATYAGDGNFATSNTTLIQTVTAATTSTVTTSSADNTPVGQSVTYTATVTPTSSPFPVTGTVAFKDGGTTIPTCSAQVVSAGSTSGTATCTTPASSMSLGAHLITAVYAATADYATSTSAALTQTVVQGTTTTTVSSSAAPTTAGLGLTYTATFVVAGGTAITPGGTVAFTDGSTVLCAAAPVVAQSATCVAPNTAQTTGTHAIAAVYSGDANFVGSTGTLSQLVNAAPVTVTVTSPGSPSDLGAPVLYTITVAAANGSNLIPGSTSSGTVTVVDSVAGTVCTVAAPQSTVPGTSTWQCLEPAASMTAGSHTITATYGGDSYFASGSGTWVQDVDMQVTGSTTSIASPGSPSYVGEPVTYTASVNGNRLFAPTGPVAFYSGTSIIPGCAAVSPGSTSGSASTYQCTEPGPQMPVGSQGIHAVFAGDTNYGGSTSPTITQVVSMGATSTNVGDSAGTADPSLAGIPSSYTATVTPSQSSTIQPTGTVAFADNGVPIAGCTAVAVTPGVADSTAACTEPSPSMLVGTHLITAIFSGDSNYITSDDIAGPFDQQVDQNTATTTVAGPGPGSYGAGQPLAFTATVTAGGIGLGNVLTPTGTVTFSDASGPLCTAPASPAAPGVAAAVCTFSSTLFTVGPNDVVTATYNGDSQYHPGSGATAAPTFVQATPDVVIASSTAAHPTHGNASVVDAAVTYTATFTNPYTTPTQGLVGPTGTATFHDTYLGVTTTICSVPVSPGSVSGTSTATCVESSGMSVGDHVITVTYSGDTNFTVPTSPSTPTWTQHVVADDATITLTPPTPANGNTFPANNLVYSVYTPVTLQATLSSLSGSTPFTANGDGSVTFSMNGVAIDAADFPNIPFPVPDCTDMPVSGPPTATVSCSGFPMPKGNDTFTVAYLDTSGQAGYNSDLGSTSYTWQVVFFATNTQIVSNPSNPVTGQSVTLTAAVTPSSGAAVLPTGTLTFSVNGTPVTCASPAVLSDANPPVATCTLPNGLPGGTDVIQATYPGDTWYAASIGSLSMTVGQAASSVGGFRVTTSSGSTSPVSGQTLKFSVGAVAAVAPGVGTPTGTVTVTTPSTAKVLCVITLVNGAGSCYDSSVQVPSGSQVPFTATYSGDAGFTSSSATTAVNMAPETALVTSITTSPAPVTYGQAMTYTVTLAPQFPGTVTTGTVALTGLTATSLGATPTLTTLCTVTLVSSSDNTGSCTFTPNPSIGFLPTGADKFSATYSGDVNFAPGTTGSTTAFVNRSSVTTSVTVNPQNPVYGQLPSFAVTLTPAIAGTTPTGTVQILSSQTGLTPLCSYTVSSSLVFGSSLGTCSAAQLLVAQNNVTFTAVYSGDANFSASNGTTLTNVQKAGTNTTVTPSASSSSYGQPQTFTVGVATQVAPTVPPAPVSNPTGTVTVTTPGVLQPLCTATLTNGTGTCTTTLQVPTGSGIVYQASYSGDANFLASVGLSSANAVTPAPATVTVTTTQSSSNYGSETAQVISSTVSSTTTGTPTGTVTYTAGGATLCTAALVPTAGNGAGSCSPASGTVLVPGSYTITATYSGDVNFTAPTTAPTKPWTVAKATGTMTTGVSTPTVVYGNESQASFSVTVASPGTGTPTGTVTFKQGTTTLCTVTLVSGSGSCTPGAAALAASGSAYTVVASYSGDANFAAPANQNVALTVSKASTSTTLGIAPSTATYGNETGVSLTVTVGPQFTGTPSGTVTLKAGATTLCAAPTLSGGIASCTVSSQTLLGVGSYTVIAAYAGDTNFAASSTFGFLTVAPATTSTTVAVSPSSVSLGQEATASFTPTLAVTPTSAGTPTGSVTLTATNTTTHVATALCTVTAAQSDGTHSCSPANGAVLATGTYSVTASYPGDANFSASNGTAVGTFTVTAAPASSLTLTLVPSGTSAAYGNESALTYSVSLGSANPLPTGTVAVTTTTAGSTVTLCTVTLTNAVGSCAVTSPTLLAVSAMNPVVATYTGDANYAGTVASTNPVNLAIVKATTTTGFVLSTSVVSYGGESATVITGTVVPGFTYGTATGTVTLKTGSTTLCTIGLTALTGNVGSCSPTDTLLAVAGSPFSITATYSGDGNFTGSTSSAQTLTVVPAVTTTTLAETPPSVVVGQETSVAFTPTITAAPSAAGAPSGSVTVSATNTVTGITSVLCSMAAAQADGTHTCAPASAIGLAPGTYTLTAAYPGDPNFTASSATAPAELTVLQAPSGSLTVGLTPSATSVPYGNEASVTYSVSFGTVVPTPTGTVAVTTTTAGSTVTLCTVTLSGGSGACAVTSPTLLAVSAVNPVVATYTGDGNYSGSVSSTAPVNLAVTQAATTTAVSVVPAGVIYGSEHTALITSTVRPAFAGIPTGTVSITTTVAGDPVTLCTLTLPATTCTPPDTALPAGSTYSLAAAYSGDANFSTSSGTDPGALAVSPAATATSLVLSASTVQYGISPTFTAAVSPTTSGTPTGTVAILTIVAGSPVTLCTIDLPATSCSGTGIALATAASPYSVIAIYSGDGNYTTSTSSSQNLTVTSNSTTTVATVSPPSVTYGNEHTAVISVTIAHTGAGTPTGTVAVTYPGGTVCDITLSGGAGSCSPGDSDLAVGPYALSASYSGDSAYSGSSSAPMSLTVTKATTSPSVAAAPSTVTYGDLSSSVLTATVTPQFTGTPTGSVTFTVGPTTLCTVTLPATTCTPAPGVQLGVGTHAVTAVYAGDTDFAPSTATIPSVLTVTQATTSTAVAVSPSTIAFGTEDEAVFSVAVTPQFTGSPSGTVTITTGTGADVTTLCTVTLPSVTCTPSAQAMPVGGPYALTAVYSGDADFAPSTGTDLPGLTVTPSPTSTIVSLTPASVAYGSEQGVTLTAEVQLPAVGPVAPSGTVVFTSGASPLCTAAVSTLLGITTASCNLSAAALDAAGTGYDVTGTYSGDASFDGSSGTAVAGLTVTPAVTTTTITSPPQTATYGDESAVTLVATVSSAAVPPVPGDVSFGATTAGPPVQLCQAPVVAGVASCSVPDTALGAGTYGIVATASGDTNFGGSVGDAPASVTIDPASTTAALVSVTPANVTFGTSGPTVSVSVAPQYLGGPTGTVTVTAVDTGTSGSTPLCTATLVVQSPGGTPSTGECTAGTVTLAPGTYDLDLRFTSDTPNFTASTATAPAALLVAQDTSTTAITSVVPTSASLGDEGSVVISTAVTPVGAAPGAPAPTGTVTVSTPSGGQNVTVCTVTLPATGCHPTPNALAVGNHTLTATYAGDAHYTGSVSETATLVVTEAMVSLHLTTSNGSLLPGRPVTYTATVVQPAGLPVPTGSVRFTDPTSGATLCATVPLVTAGGVTTATCTTILPTTPVQQIDAAYSGDIVYGTAQATLVQDIRHGYWTVARDGGVFSFGDAQFFGSMGGKPLNKPVVGISGTADAGGYWLVASDGGIFAFGDAQFYGSTGNEHLNQPVVGMQPTRDGKGYWLVAADGGVFNYGDAQFYGSAGAEHLNSPIVGMVATADGLGYFLVAADGGVFAYGDARFAGGGTPGSTSPIVGLAPSPSGAGYWLAAADGAVFNYGDARFFGSMQNQHLAAPIVGTASTTDGGGYWLVASDGGVFSFGNAIYDGSAGNVPLNSPMVSLADI